MFLANSAEQVRQQAIPVGFGLDREPVARKCRLTGISRRHAEQQREYKGRLGCWIGASEPFAG